MDWKKTIHPVHTNGAPPSKGKIVLAANGWMKKIKTALKKFNNAYIARTIALILGSSGRKSRYFAKGGF